MTPPPPQTQLSLQSALRFLKRNNARCMMDPISPPFALTPADCGHQGHQDSATTKKTKPNTKQEKKKKSLLLEDTFNKKYEKIVIAKMDSLEKKKKGGGGGD